MKRKTLAAMSIFLLAGLALIYYCGDTGFDWCVGVLCDDENECTEDTCDPADGSCKSSPIADNTDCDFAGLPGLCMDGVCQDAALCQGVECDGNPCTLNEPPCDPFTGKCPAPTEFAPRATICDLQTVDDGFCDGLGHCIEPQGDLEPVAISFDGDNRLQVTITNRSMSVLPAGVGNIQVFVDGKAVADLPLGSLVDDSYRQAGGMQVITFDVRIAGDNRRIGIAVDSMNEILETNEDHNQYTRTVTPPVIPGPDLVVSDLGVEPASSALQIELRNDGTEPWSGAEVDLEIKLDDMLIAELSQPLPVLGPGATTLVSPTPPVPITSSTKVRVSLSTDDSIVEIDNTNQSRTELLPLDTVLSDYGSLLADPKIAGNLRWENASGVNGLSDAQTADLLDAIRGLETDRPVHAPPPEVESIWGHTEEIAWHIFVGHVAHMLWVENNRLVAWRLVDMPDSQLSLMLDGREWFQYVADEDRYGARYGPVLPWNPRAGYEFLSNFRMIRGSQLGTIFALTAWFRARLYHAAGEDPVEQYGHAGLPSVDRILYALEGRRHLTPGCGGTTGLYVALLRTINIPTSLAKILFDTGYHCRPSFLSVDRSMSHGDDPYNAIQVNSSRTFPVGDMFHTTAQMEELFLAPVPDCNGPVCNTVGQQALHNMLRYKIKVSYECRGDYLPKLYQTYGPEYLRDVVLHGIQIGGETITYAYPLFSESEKDAMVLAIEEHLTALGRGDIEAGKMVVYDRFRNWELAKSSSTSAMMTPESGVRDIAEFTSCPPFP